VQADGQEQAEAARQTERSRNSGRLDAIAAAAAALRGASDEQLATVAELAAAAKALERGVHKAVARGEMLAPVITSIFECDAGLTRLCPLLSSAPAIVLWLRRSVAQLARCLLPACLPAWALASASIRYVCTFRDAKHCPAYVRYNGASGSGIVPAAAALLGKVPPAPASKPLHSLTHSVSLEPHSTAPRFPRLEALVATYKRPLPPALQALLDQRGTPLQAGNAGGLGLQAPAHGGAANPQHHSNAEGDLDELPEFADSDRPEELTPDEWTTVLEYRCATDCTPCSSQLHCCAMLFR
jgi:hypothetical protein